MNRFSASSIAVVLGVAFSACAAAQTMSKEQYKTGMDGIAADYKSARGSCGSLSGNAKDICLADAGGREKVAKAELDAENRPSEDATYKVRLARAEAAYSLAKEKCDDSAGNVKDVCVKEAKAAAVAAKADAKALMTTAKARNAARDKSLDAHRDATTVKRDADYAVAKEKCEAFAGDAKSSCMNDAKARFGKS